MIREQAHNALLRKMDGGGDVLVGDFDIGDLWSDGEGDGVGPRPTHDGGMDTMSMEQLGLKAQDVPADGNCLLHAFAQAQRRTSHAAKATPTQVLREQLAKFVEGRQPLWYSTTQSIHETQTLRFMNFNAVPDCLR